MKHLGIFSSREFHFSTQNNENYFFAKVIIDVYEIPQGIEVTFANAQIMENIVNAWLHEGVIWGIKYAVNVYKKETGYSQGFFIKVLEVEKRETSSNPACAFAVIKALWRGLHFFIPKKDIYFDIIRGVFVFPNANQLIPLGSFSINEDIKRLKDKHPDITAKETSIIKKEYINRQKEYHVLMQESLNESSFIDLVHEVEFFWTFKTHQECLLELNNTLANVHDIEEAIEANTWLTTYIDKGFIVGEYIEVFDNNKVVELWFILTL